jgi:hypothetical protein
LKINGKKGFTLAEVLIGSLITVMVLTGTMTLFVHYLWAIRNGVGSFMLTRSARAVREDILRGKGKGDGLREAVWDSITISGSTTDIQNITFNVDTNNWPTSQTNDDIVYGLQASNKLYYTKQVPSGATDYYVLQKGNFKVEKIAFSTESTSAGNFLITDITTSCTVGGCEFFHEQKIRTRILN